MKEDRRNKQEETDILMYTMLMTQFLLSLPINIESDLNNVNFYKIINSKDPIVFINGYKYNKVLYIMKILEKLLLYYISLKVQVMNSNSSKSYIAIENNVLKAKKIEKNKQYKEHEVLQIIERNKKIIEKNNKVLFIKNKKIYDNGRKVLVDKKEEKKAISEKKQQEDVYNNDKELFLTY